MILKAAVEGLVNGDYPRNSLGKTYGSTLSASYVGYEPDLISAVSQEDGTEGCFESRRLLGPYSGGEEAIACDNWREPPSSSWQD